MKVEINLQGANEKEILRVKLISKQNKGENEKGANCN